MLGFFIVAVVLIVTPGQDTALTIRHALAGGRPAGLATAAGVSLGQAVWTLLTSAGVVALLLAFEPGFTALRYAGAAYLVALGAVALRDAVRRRREDPIGPRARTSMRARSAFTRGLLSNLSNPKMVVFFPTLLPQFVPAGHSAAWLLPLLGLCFSAMTLIWLSAYTLVVVRAGNYLRRAGFRRAMDAILGTVLVGLGARLAFERP